MRFRVTVTCARAAVAAWADNFGNTAGEARAAVTFEAAFAPPGSQAGSRIIDGILRETTVTKPTLYIDHRSDNAAALAVGAIVSGDEVIVGGEKWQVDGDPGRFINPFTKSAMPLVVELRRAVG